MENIKDRGIYYLLLQNIKVILMREERKETDGKNFVIKVSTKDNILMISLMDMDRSKLISIFIKDCSSVVDLMVMDLKELSNMSIWDSL